MREQSDRFSQQADDVPAMQFAKRARIETPSDVHVKQDDVPLAKQMITTFGVEWTSAVWREVLSNPDTTKTHVEAIIKLAEEKGKTYAQTASDIWDTFVLPQQLADRSGPKVAASEVQSCNFGPPKLQLWTSEVATLDLRSCNFGHPKLQLLTPSPMQNHKSCNFGPPKLQLWTSEVATLDPRSCNF